MCLRGFRPSTISVNEIRDVNNLRTAAIALLHNRHRKRCPDGIWDGQRSLDHRQLRGQQPEERNELPRYSVCQSSDRRPQIRGRKPVSTVFL